MRFFFFGGESSCSMSFFLVLLITEVGFAVTTEVVVVAKRGDRLGVELSLPPMAVESDLKMNSLS